LIVLNSSFEILFTWRKRTVCMQAKLALETTSYERWELAGGDKLMYFENNRPALVHTNNYKKLKTHWRLIKGIEYITNPEAGADMLKEIWRLIERLSVNEKDITFQEVRNKR
jgi:hypothetical protein